MVDCCVLLIDYPGSPDTKEDSQVVQQIWKETVWLTALFTYSTVSDVALKLVDCIEIEQDYLLFHATSYKCFSSYHGLEYLVFLLVLLVLLFPLLVVVVTRKRYLELKAENEAVAGVFKDTFWWWEGMLMARRLVLVILSVLPISLVERQALLACTCIVNLAAHLFCLPFNHDRVNTCESLILFVLSLISVVSMLKHQVTCTGISST